MIRKLLTILGLAMLLPLSGTARATLASPVICPGDRMGQYTMPQGLKTGDELYNWELGGNYNVQAVLGPLTDEPNGVVLCTGAALPGWPAPSEPNLELCPADHPEPYFLPRNPASGDVSSNTTIPQGVYNVQAVFGPDGEHPDTVLICGKADPPPADPVTGQASYTG